MCVLSRFSHVRPFATLWTLTRQPPLSLVFSRQKYWSGLPCLLPWDLPDPETRDWNPVSYAPAFQADSLLLSHQKKERKSRSVVSESLRPHGLYSPWNSPGQNTGVGRLSLLQGIFPTRDRTQFSLIAGRFFTSWATREAH